MGQFEIILLFTWQMVEDGFHGPIMSTDFSVVAVAAMRASNPHPDKLTYFLADCS